VNRIHQSLELSPAVVTQFAEQGFVQLSRVLDPVALQPYADVITRLTLELNTQQAPLEERDTYSRAFLQVMNLWQHSAVVSEFVRSERLAHIAAQLLGVRAVRLYHDQALYKEPGGGITPAHADQYYWPFASDRAVTAWIPLQPVPRDMGPLAFYAGSHRIAFGRDLPISDESEREIVAAMTARRLPLHEQPFEFGDVSFHLGWTFHRAGANTTRQPRSVMTIIYIDTDMRLIEAMNEPQRRDWEQWCAAAMPGERIETPLNPELSPNN
jgi:ectoine hydroxylase-related dioxygenase (phytanoyl-CoA dioxygenase family)